MVVGIGFGTKVGAVVVPVGKIGAAGGGGGGA